MERRPRRRRPSIQGQRRRISAWPVANPIATSTFDDLRRDRATEQSGRQRRPTAGVTSPTAGRATPPFPALLAHLPAITPRRRHRAVARRASTPRHPLFPLSPVRPVLRCSDDAALPVASRQRRAARGAETSPAACSSPRQRATREPTFQSADASPATSSVISRFATHASRRARFCQNAPQAKVDLGLLAADVGVAAANTLDRGQGVGDALLAIDVGVKNTQNVRKVLGGDERLREEGEGSESVATGNRRGGRGGRGGGREGGEPGESGREARGRGASANRAVCAPSAGRGHVDASSLASCIARPTPRHPKYPCAAPAARSKDAAPAAAASAAAAMRGAQRAPPTTCSAAPADPPKNDAPPWLRRPWETSRQR